MTHLYGILADLFTLSLFVLAFTGLGALVLRAAKVPLASRGESWFFACVTGSGVAGYAVFLLSALGLLSPSAFRAVMAILAAASLAGWKIAGKDLVSAGDVPDRPMSGTAERGAALCLAVLLFLALLLSLVPETGKDALMYHLPLPRAYLENHGFRFVPGDIFSNSPLHAEMLYTLALFVRGETLAKLLHFAALLGVLHGMRIFSRRHVAENRCPAASLLVFASIPIVFSVSHSSYVDLFVALYVFAAFFAFANWSVEERSGWLGLAGFFTGLALSCKYTTLIVPFLGVLGILWVSRQKGWERQVFRNLLVHACAIAIFGSPFYLKNLSETGNPFFPFLYGIFGGTGWDLEQARLYDAFVDHLGMGRGLGDYLLLPWNLSLRAAADSPRFDGIVGPVFLFSLPFLAGMRRIAPALKLSITFSVLWFLFWASSAQQSRYLIPVFPFLALAVGTVVSCRPPKGGWAFRAAGAIVAACIVFAGYQVMQDFRKIGPLGYLAGTESRVAFLTRIIPSYPMYRFLDTDLTPGGKTLLIYMKNYRYLCEADVYSDSMFESYTIQKILSSAGSPDDVLRELRTRGFNYLMYDSRYVFGELSLFSREEQDLFSRFQAERLTLLRKDGAYRLYGIAGS